jgi:hypothetical protein
LTAPDFVRELLGRRSAGGNPNTSDAGSNTSIAIAAAMLSLLGVPDDKLGSENPAGLFETGIMNYLASNLVAADRTWTFGTHTPVTQFLQYEHLARVQAIIESDETRTLAAEIGRDYVIEPDVVVGIETDAMPFLHAAVSCKWTIRSDRVQNVRHEAVILTRHRRGRQPNIVVVTAEPMPTRIASIARGTGEIDAVYHVALEELTEATALAGTAEQIAVLEELTGQKRLLDFSSLPAALAF